MPTRCRSTPAALADPSIITAGALAFGSQAILVAIDAKRASDGSDRWTAYVHGGRKDTGIDAIEWARRPRAVAPARSCSRAWTATAPRMASTSLTRTVARAVDIPVIASGGVGKLEHFAQGIIEGEADAVLAASVFHFGELTVRQVKEYMAKQGIPVRL